MVIKMNKTERHNLSIYTKLNIDADHIATNSTTNSINTHVRSMSFAVYDNNKYIHHKIYRHMNNNLMQTKQGIS